LQPAVNTTFYCVLRKRHKLTRLGLSCGT